MRLKFILAACLSIAAMTTASDPRQAPAAAGSPPPPVPAAELSALPRSTLSIESGGQSHEFDIWVADSPAARARGLMFVKQLPKRHGMLFLFDEPQNISMWMKNTFISLDMLFIAQDGHIMRIARRTRPHSLTPIEARGMAVAVLEIAGGECARLAIEVGGQVRHPAF